MRIVRSMAAAALALAVLAGRAHAQDRIYVRPEPGTPVVAVQVLVSVGPVDEPANLAGISYVAARSVVEPSRALLDSLGARLTVDPQKDAMAFTLTAAPDTWAEAARALLVALFRDPVDSVATIRQRAAIIRELQARAPNPADALVRERDKAVYGEDHPWGRPPVGTAATVQRIRVSQVDGYLRQNFTPERSVVAVVGPVDREEALDVIRPHMPEGDLVADSVPAPQPADTLADVDYDAITTWVSASWRFGPDADVEAMRMLAKLALDRISFGPSRPSVYDSRAEVVRFGDGGELRLTLVVPPRESRQWAASLRRAVAGYADEPLSAQVFAERLRRYRGLRLMELDLPEARASAMARAARLGDRAATLADFTRLTPERLQQAARSLETPVVIFLGPRRNEGGGG